MKSYNKKTLVRIMDPCNACGGSGHGHDPDDFKEICDGCDGRGYVEKWQSVKIFLSGLLEMVDVSINIKPRPEERKL